MVNFVGSAAVRGPSPMSCGAIQEDLMALVTQPYASEPIASVASYFELPSLTVAFFGTRISLLNGLVGQEPDQNLAKHAGDILERYRAQPSDLSQLMVLLQRDWMQAPLLKALQLTGTIDLAVGALALFNKFGYDIKELFEEKALIGGTDQESEKEALLATAAIGMDFRLEVRSGIYERRGGLDFSLRTQDGVLVSTMGVLFGEHFPLIVNLQGGGAAYRRYHRELARQIGAREQGLDPFDWMIEGLATWAQDEGYRHLLGASYRLNGWLELHFDKGDFPESRRAHFEKLYDLRFRGHGMASVTGAPLLFQKDLVATGAIEAPPALFQTFIDLMADVSVGE